MCAKKVVARLALPSIQDYRRDPYFHACVERLVVRVGWIGTGIMGAAMCEHIIQAGHSVSVYNRTASKAKALCRLGATYCDSAAAVAGQSDIVFTIVGMPQDVESVYLGPDGLIANAPEGAVLVDMTTAQPGMAKDIHQHATRRGIDTIDAPVSGGDVGARNGTLAIMAGGSKPAFEKALPFFQLMGSNIAHVGGAGAGQHTKMSNQILIASTMLGVVESLKYAGEAGLDLDRTIEILGSGAASSWSITHLGPRMVRGDFEPGFMIKHFLKDLRIAMDEADHMNLSLPGTELARRLYDLLNERGLSGKGTQALYVLDG